jgi:hypothetical protein
MYGQLYISPGGQLRLLGNTQLTLHNTNLINNGNIAPGLSLVTFTGNNNSTISGSQNVAFNDVEIKKINGSAVLLQRNIFVSHNAIFTSGNLNLNGFILDLGESGSLVGEKESSRIMGSNGGQILYSTDLNNPNIINPANLGLMITSAQNLGRVLIRRGHKSQVNNYGNGNSILRYYDIVPMNPVPFSATLRIKYFDGELNGLTENSLVFWNSSDNLHWINKGFTSGNTNINYVEKTGINTFGRWSLSSNNNPLPVRFILFNLKCEYTKVWLNWKTAQEQNSSHFAVEKSANSINWTAIGNVPAAGNSNTEKSYSFADKNPVTNCYYRIAQYDLDGRAVYTSIFKSPCSKAEQFTVWPNPFNDKIFVNIPAENKLDVVIKLFDGKGALVKKQNAIVQAGVNQLTILTGELSHGMYTLSIETVEGSLHKSVKLIKTK